ncbi:DMT family transporter [Sphingomonas sp. C3-2]|uniref:DMT family transporter n=1 Tax=Sphingomonas sp. C3-2 TaxID=3062169 RepID=UPI00294B0366|nr:DMT family transporter [Sphingomonas sp. C3-2]WOK37835.1 DMT family transporter [Sphingomonas sp. C3-2]
MTAVSESGAGHRGVILGFIAVTCIWGSTWLVIRDQLGVVPASWSVAYRFLIAGLTMLAFAVVRRHSLRLDRAGFLFALGLGLSQFVLNFNFVYRAEMYITSGIVAVIYALLVVPNALFGFLFLGQRVTRGFIVGSVIALVGLGLLFVHEAHAGAGGVETLALGLGLSLLGVLSASTANVMQATERSRRYPMASMLAWAMLIGSLIDAAYAWATVGPPVFEMRLGYVAGLFYLGVVASAVAFTLYFGIIREIGPAKAAYSSVLVPIIAMLLSTLFEGYDWSLLAASGCALALGGLVVAMRARSPAR